MIVYFDTSAFVPLLVTEAGTPLSQELRDSADGVVTTRLLYVEAAAALARAAGWAGSPNDTTAQRSTHWTTCGATSESSR